jgi:hypothetical protein
MAQRYTLETFFQYFVSCVYFVFDERQRKFYNHGIFRIQTKQNIVDGRNSGRDEKIPGVAGLGRT